MDFRFKPRRNVENLLSHYSEEDILEALGVPITNKMFKSPFRKDKHPTCSIRKSPSSGRIRFRDWSDMDDSTDVFGVVMHYNGCTFAQAVEQLWELMDGGAQVNVTVTRIREKILEQSAEPVSLVASTRSWSKRDLDWWGAFGISLDTLNRYEINPVDQVFMDERLWYQYIEGYVKPAYRYNFGDTIKVYFPHKKEYRFLHQSGSVMQGYQQLPDKGSCLVITKSLKDVCLLAEYDIAAIAPQSETTVLSAEQLTELTSRFSTIVVLMDNDRTGIKALRKYKALDMNICMIPRLWKVKDISDFRKKYGADKTSFLIKSAIEYYT